MTVRPNFLAALARTTAFRLALLFVAMFIAAAAMIALAVIWQTNEVLTGQVLRALRAERDELIQLSGTRGGMDSVAREVAERSLKVPGALYLLLDASGVRLAGNLATLPSELSADRPGGLFSYASEARAVPARLAAGLAIATPGGGRLVIARDIEDQRGLLHAMRGVFLWSFAGLALAGIVGGVVAGRLLLGRIEAVNATSRQIMAGDLSRRVPLTGAGDEIDGLAANLNAMLERIEQLMAGMREVSDNIAHDLKTPLNRLRARAEAALRDERGAAAWKEGLERTIEDADDLIRTFNALLQIARLEAGATEETLESFDLAAAVRDIAELYEPVAEEAALAIAVSAGAGPIVRANRELVGQAVANLIDNALKYGAQAGQSEPISVRLAETGAGVEITVADRGPGIRPQDRDRALRRFVRLDQSRTKPGTGLGLSLVAAVARLHGGSVKLADNAPGLAATLVLPARLVVSSGESGAQMPPVETSERPHAATRPARGPAV